MSVPVVSIVVVSYNTAELLAASLRSAVERTGALPTEVVVVDNASEDGSAEMVERSFSGVHLIRNRENRGFAAANNQAFAASNGRYVLLLNSDAVLEEGAVERLVAFMDAHPDVGIAGGQLLNADGSFQGSYARFPSLLGELLLSVKLATFVYGPDYPSYPAEKSRDARLVDWVSGAFLMARRSAIEAVGPMDEEYFMYTEETDWCYRMRRAGWQVGYVPEARVTHLVGRSSRRAPERRRGQVYRSKWLYFRKHHGPLPAACFRAAVKAASAAKLVAWASFSLLPARRDSARQQVRSYAVLLSSF